MRLRYIVDVRNKRHHPAWNDIIRSYMPKFSGHSVLIVSVDDLYAPFHGTVDTAFPLGGIASEYNEVRPALFIEQRMMVRFMPPYYKLGAQQLELMSARLVGEMPTVKHLEKFTGFRLAEFNFFRSGKLTIMGANSYTISKWLLMEPNASNIIGGAGSKS